MTNDAPSIAVEELDPMTASEDDLRSLHALVDAEYAERWPEDPVDPFDHWRKDVLSTLSWRRHDRWIVRDGGGAIAAVAVLTSAFTESNRHHADLDTYVRADHRGRGVARALLLAASDRALAEGRTLLNVGGPDGSTSSSFCDHLGAVRGSIERKSRIVLADLDRPMLEGWVAKATERAVGYSLLAWDGPVPEECLEKFVQLTMVMNTAPRDDLDVEDWIHTPERHRENEARAAEKGLRWWTLVVRHDDSDGLVGYTELEFPPAHPEVAWQEATAVDPRHRDRGIGRWLKATNALRLLDEKPEVRCVDTWNAFSNGPMLGINIAMGFEVVNTFGAYQIETAALSHRLALRR